MKKWKTGMGEFVGFTVSVACLLYIFVIFIGFAILQNGITSIEDATTMIEREIVVQESKEEAEELAEKQAKKMLSSCHNIPQNSIRTKINYAGGCKSWQKGQFGILRLRAKVKTMDPFTTKTYESHVLFMIERNLN